MWQLEVGGERKDPGRPRTVFAPTYSQGPQLNPRFFLISWLAMGELPLPFLQIQLR